MTNKDKFLSFTFIFLGIFLLIIGGIIFYFIPALSEGVANPEEQRKLLLKMAIPALVTGASAIIGGIGFAAKARKKVTK